MLIFFFFPLTMFILLMGFQKYFEIFVCSSSPFLKDVIKKKKALFFYFLLSSYSYSCILGNARSRPGAISPEAAVWSLGRLTDFTLVAYFAEILYSSLTKCRFDEDLDTAAFLFMFLLLQKLIVTPLQLVFLFIIICHIQ